LSSFDSRGVLAKLYYDLLWRLYGFSLGKDYMEIKDVVFGQVALSILLYSAFYEYARNYNSHLRSLSFTIVSDPVKDVRKALG
jgi:hypothetical protein